MVRSTNELRNIWCVAIRRPLDLGQPTVNSHLEVQVPALDPDEGLATLGLSTMTLEELRRLQSQWNSQDVATETQEYVSYLDQTREVLSKMA